MPLLARFEDVTSRLSARCGLHSSAGNRIFNDRRFPSEAQALRLAAGFVLNDKEMDEFKLLDEVDTAAATLARIIEKSELPLEQISVETSIGVESLRAFLAKTLAVSEEELARIFLAVVVRDERRSLVNRIIEAAGDYLLGEAH